MTTVAILCGVVAGLIVAEYTALAPLVAKSIMRRSAWIYYAHDEAVAAERADEWQALIEARPGNLLKLGTAFFFGTGALGLLAGRAGQRALRRPLSPMLLVQPPFIGSMSISLIAFRNDPAMASIAFNVLAFSVVVCNGFLLRRKRLGYRVQMDTLATSAPHEFGADMLQANGRGLTEPSFVLLRLENPGLREIVEDDYLDQGNKTGIRVTFPGRRVVGITVTELSRPNCATSSSRGPVTPRGMPTASRSARTTARASSGCLGCSSAPVPTSSCWCCWNASPGTRGRPFPSRFSTPTSGGAADNGSGPVLPQARIEAIRRSGRSLPHKHTEVRIWNADNDLELILPPTNGTRPPTPAGGRGVRPKRLRDGQARADRRHRPAVAPWMP